MRNPCNKLRWWYGRSKASREYARLTHLAPQDNAFDCSKPQSIKPNENEQAPPLHSADSYYQYLDRALADPHVFNIALAGHFGSGKSTILRTYEKHYARKRRFLNISLATFGTDVPAKEEDNEPASDDGEENQSDCGNANQPASSEHSSNKNSKGKTGALAAKTRRQNHLIEHSILQQLFYQVPKNRIPRSRFKRISKLGVFLPRAAFLFWLLCVGVAVALFKPAAFVNARYVHSIITAKTGPTNILLTIGALLAFILPAVTIFHKLRSVTLRKLNLKNCEIEIDEGKDPSALNKHLDEILYFFEETDFDVVVLEDLDRFRTTDVFTKLREINTLVNRNIQARRREWWRFRSRKSRRVVFIYAIKDDMFTGEERTKFFDLVIPVIPVVNHLNSRELLTQALHTRGFMDIDDELINDVAIFVRDMRLLHNTVNEYTVYRRRLNMAGLDPEKLFAMIMYKNVCPEDFAKLHDSDGKLQACIDSKADLIGTATKELRTKQQRLRERMTAIDAEQLRSVQELRKLYVLELQQRWLKHLSQLMNIVLGGQAYPWAKLMEDEPFRLLVEAGGQVQSRQGHAVNLDFPGVEKVVDPQRTYAQREELIQSRAGKKRQQLEQELARLDGRIRELRHAKLAELLDIVGSETLPSKPPPVVRMFLCKGYIDETTYLSYLSYFYEGSLSNSDWVFVQGVKTGQAFDLDYPLDNVSEIAARKLGHDEAISLAPRNIYLLHHFATKGTSVFAEVVKQFQRDSGAAVEIVSVYLAHDDSDASVLIPVLYECWPEFWECFAEREELSTNEWKRHVGAIVRHISLPQLKAVCERTQLREDIAEGQFLSLAESLPDPERVTAFLDTVRPCFQELPEMDKDSTVARFIYDHGLYAITAHNIVLLHNLFAGALPDSFPPTITHLRGQEDSPLTECIEERLQAYMEVLIAIDGALDRESEQTVLSLLNDDRLSKEIIEALVDGRCVPVEQIQLVKSAELWPLLLKCRSLLPTWSNVLAYHQECAEGSLDDLLIDYLSDEKVAAELSKRCMDALFDDGEGAGLAIMTQILACDGIPTSCVARLLKAIPDGESFNDASAIASAHLPVAHPRIEFSVVNYEHMRNHAAPSIGEYVKGHLEAFYRLASELSITGEDLTSIISVHARKNRKREIVTTVCAHGLPVGLAPVAGVICDLMIDDATFAEVFDPDALATIISSARDRTTKIQTLTSFMDKLSNDGVCKILQTAGHPYEDIAVTGKRPLLSKGKMNSNLAASLEQKGLISQAKEEEDGVRIITFSGKN
jgi:hypothetical protein